MCSAPKYTNHIDRSCSAIDTARQLRLRSLLSSSIFVVDFKSPSQTYIPQIAPCVATLMPLGAWRVSDDLAFTHVYQEHCTGGQSSLCIYLSARVHGCSAVYERARLLHFVMRRTSLSKFAGKHHTTDVHASCKRHGQNQGADVTGAAVQVTTETKTLNNSHSSCTWTLFRDVKIGSSPLSVQVKIPPAATTSTLHTVRPICDMCKNQFHDDLILVSSEVQLLTCTAFHLF